MTPKKDEKREAPGKLCALHEFMEKELSRYHGDIARVFDKVESIDKSLDEKIEVLRGAKMPWKAFVLFAVIIFGSVGTTVGLVETHNVYANRELRQEFISSIKELKKEVMESQEKQDALLSDCDQARREWNRLKHKIDKLE